MASSRATDAAFFTAYVAQGLGPALRPGDIVIVDNLASHKSAEARRLIEAAGATVRFPPAYSPDLSPIEAIFSKLKPALRRLKARTFESRGEALRSVRPRDIRGWFGRRGYATAPSMGLPDKKPL